MSVLWTIRNLYPKSQSQPSFPVLVNFHELPCDEIMLRPQKEKTKQNKRKNKTKLFYGQMKLPSRVNWSGVLCLFIFLFFIYLFFFSGSKQDPKNMKILEKKSDIFCRKILGKCFDLFSKISAKSLGQSCQ